MHEVTPPSSISCLTFQPINLSVVFHVDSGAGQSLCCCEDAFISLRACAIEVVGVSGSLPIYGVGTAAFVVSDGSGSKSTVLIHNCLLSQGGLFNLLSVSQVQMSRMNLVVFDPESPHLLLNSSSAVMHLPLHLTDGLYSLTMEPLSVNDTRYLELPRFDLTDKGRYVPPTLPASAECPSGPTPTTLVSSLGSWTCRNIVPPSSSRRVLAFPSNPGQDFGDNLRDFCQQFMAPLSTPPARRTYDSGNALHMSDLSVRFMGTSHDKLQRTIQLNRGLAPASGRRGQCGGLSQ